MDTLKLLLPREEVDRLLDVQERELRRIAWRLAAAADAETAIRTGLKSLLFSRPDPRTTARAQADAVSALTDLRVWQDQTADVVRAAFGAQEAQRFGAAMELARKESIEPRDALAKAILRLRIELDLLRRGAGLAIQSGGADLAPTDPAPLRSEGAARRVFIVHGRDERFPAQVEALLLKVSLDPIILAAKPNHGAATLIEKLERYGDVAFAVVIYTPDDSGGLCGEELEPRARENVVLEFGYFAARLGREHVCLLLDPAATRPSDLGGVTYHQLDAAGAWKGALIGELKAARLAGDWSKFP